jgi:fructuronate reductase
VQAQGTSDGLSLATLERLPTPYRPLVDARELTIGVVHLGVGAFHRAHQAVYTESASAMTGERCWGICAVSERSPAVAEMLTAQDGLYSVLVAGPAQSSVRVVGSLRQALFGPGQPDALTARIADPDVKLVTLTVTEKGYRHNPATRRLRANDGELIADASGRPPVTVLGQLARGLEARRRLHGLPLNVISCDNIPANGQMLGRLVDELVSLPSARFDPGLQGWIAESVRFPSAMVDRIVPATTDHWRLEVARHIGLEDRAAVVAEPFSQWVIEDHFAAPRPAWERAGVDIVADVAPYETLKLRALNGAHSALAYLGLLAGDVTIAEALSRQDFEAFVRLMLVEEVEPTLTLPEGVEFPSYLESILTRFANASLPYRCLQVATDGSQKLPQRVLGTVRDRLRAGQPIAFGALVVAAWLRAISTGVNDLGQSFELNDPLTEPLRKAIGPAREPALVVGGALGFSDIFGEDLAGDPRFRAALKDALIELSRRGTPAAVAAMVRAR